MQNDHAIKDSRSPFFLLVIGATVLIAVAAFLTPARAQDGLVGGGLPLGEKVEVRTVEGLDGVMRLASVDGRWLQFEFGDVTRWIHADQVVSMSLRAASAGAVKVRFEVSPGVDGAEEVQLADGSTVTAGPETLLKLTRTYSTVSALGHPAVGAEVDPEQQAWFKTATWEAADRGARLLLIVDGDVVTAPVVNAGLRDSFVIEGGAQGFSPNDVAELIEAIRAGANGR